MTSFSLSNPKTCAENNQVTFVIEKTKSMFKSGDRMYHRMLNVVIDVLKHVSNDEDNDDDDDDNNDKREDKKCIDILFKV